jgi:CHAD domain-containing protein
MPVDRKRGRDTFRRLGRQLSKVARKPAAEDVHGFRTCSRRVETMLEEFGPASGRNPKRLLKLLGRLRKKAGHVRDLDAQIMALRSLKIPQEPVRRMQLTRALVEERTKRERKLAKAFDPKTVTEIHKRLKRASRKLAAGKKDVLALAIRRIAELGADHAPLTEKTLHQYRIVGKRARYLAELAGKDPAATAFIAQLKRMQDVLGDWHDWLQLAEKAEGLLGDASASPLVAALRNVTRAKFRQAVHALMETRSALAEKKPATGPHAVDRRKPPTPIAPAAAVA